MIFIKKSSLYIKRTMNDTHVESKGSTFLRNYGKVGHIEDIVVHSDFRGYGLGKVMIDFLTKQSKLADCYKCILDCGEDNVGFYEKCDYERKGVQMALYM